MLRFVGLDVHKKMVQACVLDPQGKVLLEKQIPCTRLDLLEFARKDLRPTDWVAMEATTNCWSVVKLLRPLVEKAVVSNPLQTKAIAQAKVKTDKIDARVLADLLRCDYLPQVWIPDDQTQTLRRLTHHRAALVSDCTRLKNRVHSVLNFCLHPEPEANLFSKESRLWLQGIELPAEERELLDSDLRLLDQTQGELERLEDRLVKSAYQDPRVRLLMTLPGVDFTVAQCLIATLGDISRFPDGDHVAGYLGLVSSTRRSADRCYHGPITKQGNAHARWLLIQAAQHLDRHPGPLGVFFRRLAKKKNRNVAVVAVARKLAVIAYHMLKNNEPYRYAQPAATQNKLSTLRVRATKKRRPTGPKPGSAPAPHRGSGIRTRTTPSLPQVCACEDLPPVKPWEELPQGEQRMLQDLGADRFVKQLQKPRIVVRRAKASGAKKA